MQNRKGKMCLTGDGAFLTLCDRIKGEGRGAKKKKKKHKETKGAENAEGI